MDQEFWDRFDARLAEQPKTAGDATARSDLTDTARVVFSSAPRTGLAPEACADLAYRLRHELGPTVARETLERERRDLATERDRLISEGVSPRLLGLADAF